MTLPTWLFDTTWIYHITAIDNLPSILNSGLIYSTNGLTLRHRSIANEEIQNRRANKVVALPPGGALHDYVPFYFAPRSPMLCANHHGTIQNAAPQDEIVHLVSTAQKVHAQALPYVFYDRHPVTSVAQPFSDLSSLSEIDWELFFEAPLMGGYSKYWHNVYNDNRPKWLTRKEVRQSEFLVHNTFPWQCVDFVGTMNEERTNQVRQILSDCGSTTRVETVRDWYF